MHIYEVLKRPIRTEKSYSLQRENKYVFEVDRRANKIQVKEAVERIFNVDVVSVHIINVPAKKGRYGRRVVVRKPAWKKAIVTIAPGQKIEVFEGV